MDENMDEHGMARMKELMNSYYGMEDNLEDDDKGNIDSNNFQSSLYIKEMLETHSLVRLLKRDDEMVHEIKSLDSDMQMLVYENYNKFISATDTIRKMKKNVETMEKEMNHIVEGMEKINAHANEMNERLDPQRSRIDKLVCVKRLLKRLEFLFHLPQRLKKAIELKEYVKAVNYYQIAIRILKRSAHISSFGAIEEEAHEIMLNLKILLKNQFLNEKEEQGSTVNEIDDLTHLLFQLKEDKNEMRTLFLQWHARNGQKHLEMFRISSTEDSLSTIKSFDYAKEYIENIHKTFLISYQHCLESYQTFFPWNEQEKEKEIFLSFTKQHFQLYFHECKEILQRECPILPLLMKRIRKKEKDLEFETIYHPLVDCFQKIMEDMRVLDQMFPEAQFLPISFEYLEQIIEFHLFSLFGQFQQETIQYFHQLLIDLIELNRMKKIEEEKVQNLLNESTQLILMTMENLFQILKPLLSADATYAEEWTMKESVGIRSLNTCMDKYLEWYIHLINQIHLIPFYQMKKNETNQLKFFFQSLEGHENEFLETFCSTIEPIQAFNCCFFACLTRNFFHEIPKQYQNLLNSSSKNDPLAKLNKFERKEENPKEKIRKELEISSKRILQKGIEKYGQICIQILRKGMLATRWEEMKEPRDIRPSMEYLIDKLNEITKQLGMIFNQPTIGSLVTTQIHGTRDFRRMSSNPKTKTSRPNPMFHMDIERMFAKKICIHDETKLQFTLSSCNFALWKILSKAFLEFIRCFRFTKFGFQQIQLDLEFLQSFLIYFLKEDDENEEKLSIIQSLLSEVQTTSSERSIDLNPNPIEQSILVAIISTKKAKMELEF